MATLTQESPISEVAWEKLPIGIHETGEVFRQQKDLAKELGVSPSLICMAIKKKKHIEGLTIFKIYNHRFCSKCGEYKKIENFRKQQYEVGNVTKTRYASHCKNCNRLQRNDYNRRNNKKMKKYRRKYSIKYLYGLSHDEYEILLNIQDNKCAICKNPFDKTPYVDHEHSKNNVRGLLCHNCNFAIGYFKEDVKAMKNAIAYLEKHKGVFVWPV